MASFPNGFLWGATLCGHQVEGRNYSSDWWRWEQRPGRIQDGASSEIAADHFNLFEDDIALARKLGHTAMLLSIEWSRIQPAPDTFDADAIEHYVRRFHALARHAIEPVCVLHWTTCPAWFTDQFGWHHNASPQLFLQYAQTVVAALASFCRWWIPVYEPMHYVSRAYIEGAWPPGKSNPLAARRALLHLLTAHAHSYHAIHQLRSDAAVGVSVRGCSVEPRNPESPWDLRATQREAYLANALCLDLLTTGTSQTLPWFHMKPSSNGAFDFIGLSYFGAETYRFNALRPGRLFAERISGDIPRPHAAGLRQLVTNLALYNRPVFVTGAGLPTDNDADRRRYLLEHVAAIENIPAVQGYFHHSLLDGFEWTAGFARRYGLVHVDYETLARTPNPSAYLFKDICESNGIRPGAVARFCHE